MSISVNHKCAAQRAAKPMNIRKNCARLITLLVVAMLALTFGAPSRVHADASTTLMNRVDSVLRQDRRLNGASCYTAAPGVIVLYGKVFDDKSRTLAEKTALKVHGVKKVINTLTTMTGTWLEEENRINDTLQLNGFPGCTARVIGNDVYLSGQVTGVSEKQRAGRVVSSVTKLRVVNFIYANPQSVF